MNKPEIRAVLFDLDGTLVHFHHDYLFEQAEKIIPSLGHDNIHRDILHEHFSMFDFFGFVEQSVRDNFIESFWTAFDWQSFPEPKLFPSVIETIDLLHAQQLNTAIVTSRFTPVESLREKLGKTGLVHRMHHICTRPGDHIHWTDKRPLIENACRALGIKPEQAMMVGDIPTDITSARDVGISTTVAVLSGGIRREILEQAQPDLILDHVGLLKEHIF